MSNPTTPGGVTQPPAYRFWGRHKPAGKVQARASAVVADQTATIRLYDPIDSWGGMWGTSAKEVADLLDQLDEQVTSITLRINSPGGEVTEAVAILNLFRTHPAKVTAVVDGIAASAASFIATGVDELVMGRNTELMIHDARGFAYGDASYVSKYADLLAHMSDNIAGIYADKAGGSKADWRAAMTAETWYSAEEAVAAGLADRVADLPAPTGDPTSTDTNNAPGGAGVEDRFDLSVFAYAGRSNAPDPVFPAGKPATACRTPQPPTASADGFTPTQEGSSAVAFTPEQITTMRTKLGLPEDADEATILAALDEALEERAEPTPSNHIPDGHVVLPQAALEELRTAAEAGANAAVQLRAQERDQYLNSVADRFLPANRAAWAAEYDRNPEATRAYLDKAPVIVPTAELGHAGDHDTSESDALYASLFGKDLSHG